MTALMAMAKIVPIVMLLISLNAKLENVYLTKMCAMETLIVKMDVMKNLARNMILMRLILKKSLTSLLQSFLNWIQVSVKHFLYILLAKCILTCLNSFLFLFFSRPMHQTLYKDPEGSVWIRQCYLWQ